jgi:xanthine dehydrogenase accessory factor
VYAVATVVARKPPVSAHVGDRAVVHHDGEIEGFIGGACSRDIVRRQALRAMRAGTPRLLHIRPDASQTIDNGDEVTVPMACVSEGAVDVYIEPQVPKRELLIAGDTPVAVALAEIAPVLEFDVRHLKDLSDLTIDDPRHAVGIVATQGHYDEAALAALLKAGIGFVGLLASRKRGAAIVEGLIRDGIDPQRAHAIRTPVGLDIGARAPGEVAVSILAEIVAISHAQVQTEIADDEDTEAVDHACHCHAS